MPRPNSKVESADAAILAINAVVAATDQLIEALDRSSASHKNQSRVYAVGLQEKAKQAAHSLRKLSQLGSGADPTTQSTDSASLSFKEEVCFYADCFWCFSYACFDIVCNLSNQMLGLQLPENTVGCHKEFINRVTDPATKAALERLRDDPSFAEFHAYRNSSLHRRSICVNFLRMSMELGSGYSAMATSSVPASLIAQFLCDDPRVMQPAFTKQRQVVGFPAYCAVKAAKRLKVVVQKLKASI